MDDYGNEDDWGGEDFKELMVRRRDTKVVVELGVKVGEREEEVQVDLENLQVLLLVVIQLLL